MGVINLRLGAPVFMFRHNTREKSLDESPVAENFESCLGQTSGVSFREYIKQ